MADFAQGLSLFRWPLLLALASRWCRFFISRISFFCMSFVSFSSSLYPAAAGSKYNNCVPIIVSWIFIWWSTSGAFCILDFVMLSALSRCSLIFFYNMLLLRLISLFFIRFSIFDFIWYWLSKSLSRFVISSINCPLYFRLRSILENTFRCFNCSFRRSLKLLLCKNFKCTRFSSYVSSCIFSSDSFLLLSLWKL